MTEEELEDYFGTTVVLGNGAKELFGNGSSPSEKLALSILKECLKQTEREITVKFAKYEEIDQKDLNPSK